MTITPTSALGMTFKQDKLGIDAYISQWLSYFYRAVIGDVAGVWNLENGISSEVRTELFKGQRKTTVAETLTEICTIGRQIKSLRTFT